MGTVPRQEPVSNCSICHRELLNWYCWFALFSCARIYFTKKSMRRPLVCSFFKGPSCIIANCMCSIPSTQRMSLGRRNLILRSTESSRSPRVTHSFHYAGPPYKCSYGGPPYKSPKIAKIAPPAAAAVVWPRARRTHIVKKC
jgi:hypothetical protein